LLVIRNQSFRFDYPFILPQNGAYYNGHAKKKQNREISG